MPGLTIKRFFNYHIVSPNMPAKILDGTKIASDIRAAAAQQVQSLTTAGQRPGLAVILAGHNPASEIYVRNKVKACQQLGIHSEKLTPPDSVTTEELLPAERGG